MIASAQRVPFREIMRPNQRPYMLAPDEDANLVGMRLYGEGPFHRELKPATSIVKKSHFLIREGDVIYNKLFAWKGTFGIVPPKLDGMYVSDKFPTYELDRSRVSDRYLAWFFRHPGVWDQARAMSTGSAALSKLTLNPPRFLDLAVPLPDFSEQERIAGWLEALAAKISETGTVRASARSDFAALSVKSRDAILGCVAPSGTLRDVLRGAPETAGPRSATTMTTGLLCSRSLPSPAGDSTRMRTGAHPSPPAPTRIIGQRGETC